MFTSWKMGPALARQHGRSEPAELTPLTTLRIAKLMSDVGIPPVSSTSSGYGHTAGNIWPSTKASIRSPSQVPPPFGRKIVEASAGNLKRVQLELGGKGANIILKTLPLDAAVGGSAWAIFHNQGQACIAGSRILVHENIADAFLEKFVALAKSIRQGNPLDPNTESDRSLRPAIAIAFSNTSRLRKNRDDHPDRGKAPDNPDLRAGYYVMPTSSPPNRPTVSARRSLRTFVSVTRLQRRIRSHRWLTGTNTVLAADSGLATCSAPIASQRPSAPAGLDQQL